MSEKSETSGSKHGFEIHGLVMSSSPVLIGCCFMQLVMMPGGNGWESYLAVHIKHQCILHPAYWVQSKVHFSINSHGNVLGNVWQTC